MTTEDRKGGKPVKVLTIMRVVPSTVDATFHEPLRAVPPSPRLPARTRFAGDTLVQDVVTHADMWIGVACFAGALIYICDTAPQQAGIFYLFLLAIAAVKIDNAVVIMATAILAALSAWALHAGIDFFALGIFIVALMAGLWLSVLGLLTGMLYRTNRGKDFNPIIDATVTPFRGAEKSPPIKPGWSASLIWLSVTFSIEATLLFLGMYFDGWVQYAFGFVGFVILVHALMRAINDKVAEGAIIDKVMAMASVLPARTPSEADPAADVEPMLPHKVDEARTAKKRERAKHRQMFVLTVTDFTLAGLCLLGLVIMGEDAIWAHAVTFIGFVATGIWMIVLGKATGHGDPGHQDVFDPAFMLERRASMPLCHILNEVRAARGRSTMRIS